MTEQELRALVRDVIAQRSPEGSATPNPGLHQFTHVRQHASHALFTISAPGEACVIEPGVTCNHCGYCKSYGH